MSGEAITFNLSKMFNTVDLSGSCVLIELVNIKSVTMTSLDINGLTTLN